MSTLFEGIFVAVCLLIWTEICSSQSFQINRRESKDYFTIPSSECGENDCRALYKAKKTKGGRNCECICDSSTFSFHKKLNWTCIGNAETRNLFGKLFNLLFTWRYRIIFKFCSLHNFMSNILCTLVPRSRKWLCLLLDVKGENLIIA